jgi:TetR/AcrR family transcriptional regulator
MTSKNNQLAVRDTILQATLDVICQYHISHTTIRRIAEKASISPSLIHYYFPTKRDLFLATIDYLNEFYSRNHASYINTDKIRAIEKLMIMVGNQIEYTSRRKEYFVIFDFWTHAINDEEIKMKVKGLFNEWESWIRKIIAEGIQTGDFDSANADIVPNFLISMICGAAIQYLINDQVFDIHDYYDRTYRLIAKMLTAPKEVSTVVQPISKILELDN